MGGRSLVLGLHAVAVALLLAASGLGTACAEEAKAAVPLPDRAPRKIAGQGAEVELPVRAPRPSSAGEVEQSQSDNAATGAVGEPQGAPSEPVPHEGAEQQSLDPAPDPVEAKQDQAPAKKAGTIIDASRPTGGDRASTGTVASALPPSVGKRKPEPANIAASSEPSDDAQKPAGTVASPEPSFAEQKPVEPVASPSEDQKAAETEASFASDVDQAPAETAASPPSDGDQEASETAASPEPSAEEQAPAETSSPEEPRADESMPADTAGPPPSDSDQDAAASPKPSDDEQASTDTAASPPGDDDQDADAQGAAEIAVAPPSDAEQKPADTASAPPSDDDQPAKTAASPRGDDNQDAGDQGAAEIAVSPPSDAGQKPAAATALPSDAGQKPADPTASPPSEQKPADPTAAPASGSEAASPAPEPAPPPPPPSNPVVAALLTQLKDPALAKGANAADLSALEAFYVGHGDASLWIAGTDLSDKAQAVIAEIGKADEWGLSAAAFDLPATGAQSSTPEAQAAEELKLSLAILKYARFARGGRLTPSRVSALFDQRPRLHDPKTVLTEIAASDDPASYLRSLHPKHAQFARLREALVAARANGGEASSDGAVQRLIVNMERWRWMPPELGSFYVWNNVPSFIVRVVKGGKMIYAEKIIVGQLKYQTPIFSANMSSVVFHPEWTVPETILKEDLQPSLQQGGFFGIADTSILKRHGLRVGYRGKPVDADTVDWLNVNIREYTFTQPPGPDNVLGQLKFNFPNKHAVYMHDTPQRELFAEAVRTLSHGCIRVREPDRLAALLLAEDKGWSADQVRSLLARDQNDVIKLGRSIPVHLTYFTAVADDTGKIDTFSDVYGIDGRMATALFGNAAKFRAPVTAEADAGTTATVQPAARKRRSDWTSKTGIPGLFGN